MSKVILNLIRIPQVAAIVAGLLLLPAALNARMSYGYYLNLRWIVFLTFGLVGALRHANKPILVLSIAGVIMFNPLLALHLSRNAWQLLDWIALIGLAWIVTEPVRGKP